MERERWQQIDHLLEAALEREPNERAAFLDEACAGDEVLRKEVESLIESDEQAASFIESHALQRAAVLLADQPHQSLVGRVVGRYKIISDIGHGGMGEVYLAEDSTLERRVAIKFISSGHIADNLSKRRLIREARAAAKLDHPNICTVHEVAEVDNLSFIVMQYVEGETLSARIERNSIEWKEAIDIAVQVTAALAEAHSRGIIHRDIKPANIMLAPGGQVKVLDFGLAKIVREKQAGENQLQSDSMFSGLGVIAGTLSYMSPEQVRGETLDARSDLFSIGGVLYKMVTGHEPFARESTAETIAAIQIVEQDSVRSYSSEVPEALESIVEKSLQKDREERYQTAGDLLIELKSLKHRLEFEEEVEKSLPPSTGEGGKHPPAAKQRVGISGLGAADSRGALKRRRRGLIIAAATLVLAIVGLIYLLNFHPSSKAIDFIAVLPLVNANDDQETEYLADGITESLINSLSQVMQLRVVARTTAFRYKGKEIDPRQVGRELGVRAVLTGKLRQRGDSLDIQVELVETRAGSQVWGEHYDKKLSELLAVRQELAREITQKLRLRLSGEDEKQLTKGDAANTEAYEFYLKGRYLWNRRTAEGLRRAVEQFQHAIDKDPNYALAYDGLADCYLMMQLFADAPQSEVLPKAKEAALHALRIDDSLAETHASLAWIYLTSWQWRDAEEEFRRGIQLNPNYPIVHLWYSIELSIMGRLDDAMREVKRAQELDPIFPAVVANVARTYILRGDLDAAIALCNSSIELDPNSFRTRLILALAYQMQARYPEAIAEAQKGVELSEIRSSFALGALGYCYAVAGRRSEAIEILRELEKKYAEGESTGAYLAWVYAGLGDKDQAFAWLEKDFQDRSGPLAINITGYPVLDTLRGDVRYAELLHRMGLKL